MQWNSEKNLGFSTADEDKLYMPQDKSENAPTVQNQKDDPDSVYKVLTDVIRLRHQLPQLGNESDFEVIYAEKEKYPFVYRRGDYAVFLNPSDKAETISFPQGIAEEVYLVGEFRYRCKKATIGASSAAIVKMK